MVRFVIVLAVLALCACQRASADMTYTEDVQGSVTRADFTWTSNGSGAASATMTRRVRGAVIHGVTTPGEVSPSANYDIAVTDEAGENVFQNCIDDLQNRHATNQEDVYFLLTNGTAGVGAFPEVCDRLTVSVTAAGSTKEGVATLYFREW